MKIAFQTRKSYYEYKQRNSPIFEKGIENIFGNSPISPIQASRTTSVKRSTPKGRNTKSENFDLGFETTERVKSHKKHINNKNKNSKPSWL